MIVPLANRPLAGSQALSLGEERKEFHDKKKKKTKDNAYVKVKVDSSVDMKKCSTLNHYLMGTTP